MVIVLLFPAVSMANPYDDIIENIRVFQMGIIQGDLELNKYLSRAELATVAVRVMGLEYIKDYQKDYTSFKDVKGWAVPYVNIAYDLGLMNGVKKEFFSPNGKVTYVELLTVLLRVLGYEDGVDFKRYPEDYYSKALEIGLGNLYIPHDEVVTKGIAAKTINKALDLKLKDSDKELSSLQLNYFFNETIVESMVNNKVYMSDLSFNTSIVGVFSGVLKGIDDFTGYKIELLSKSGTLLESIIVNKNGSFSIDGFDISALSKLQGYKYEVYSSNGTMVLKDDLD